MLSEIIRRTTLRAFNPHFPATDEQIEQEWARLKSTAGGVKLPRPIVIFAGWRAPAAQVRNVTRSLRELTSAAEVDVLGLHYAHLGDHIEITRRAVAAIRERFGDHPVDAVAISMGGLIARAAAAGLRDEDGRTIPPIRLARLFTLATPHRGADMARLVRPDAAAAAMKPGSKFLRDLDAALLTATYELVCYARLRDRYVGTLNCAPPGRQPIWTPGLIIGSHFSMSLDRRALVDIARRLRGEPPLATPGALPRDLAFRGRLPRGT